MAATEAVQPVIAPTSLHERILSDLRGRIVSGDWPPGHRIPFEHELSAAYRCSRMTVNKALTELAKAGLIERRRRAGSFVTQPKSQSAVLEIKDVESEIQALGVPYRYELLERRKRTSRAGDRADLGLVAAVPILDVTCRHFASNQPFCLEERLISLAAVPEAAEQDFVAEAPGRWLLTRVPWTEAEHRIRASGADAAVASALGLAPGTPCLSVERRTWSFAHPVTFVRLTYPGSAHELLAHFTPARTRPNLASQPTGREA
jgi:GntR family histidine utilization transcriptional repressor